MICRLCPRECGVDRSAFRGFCGMGEAPRLARAALHQWEEPCISGDPDDSGQTGSGTVFFSGCVMRCVFCQNHDVSAGGFGKDVTVERLTEIFLELQQRGAYNINLVSPTPFVPQMAILSPFLIPLASKIKCTFSILRATSLYCRVAPL